MNAATLWPAEILPEHTRDDWRALARELRPADATDRAQMIRAKATGARWTCPRQCTNAQGDACECPCGRRCHGATFCPGH